MTVDAASKGKVLNDPTQLIQETEKPKMKTLLDAFN